MTNSNKTYPSPNQLVLEFHETYGQPIRFEPTFDVPERKMRVELILEEASEYFEANKANDLVEMADALADLVYVTYGAAITHGINLDASFGKGEDSPSTVIRNAMRKARAKVRPLPTLSVFTRKPIAMGINSAAIKYSEAAKNGGNTEKLRSSLVSIVSSCYSAAFSLGINLDEVLEEVQRSNMSKLGEDGKPIYREDGKVLKGPNFFTPDIQKVLDNQTPLV